VLGARAVGDHLPGNGGGQRQAVDSVVVHVGLVRLTAEEVSDPLRPVSHETLPVPVNRRVRRIEK